MRTVVLAGNLLQVVRMATQGATGRTLEADLRDLLVRLCVEWGFCIPPKHRNRIVTSAHLEAAEFAAQVLQAEGLDPQIETQWFRKIKNRFVEQFGESVSAADYPKQRP